MGGRGNAGVGCHGSTRGLSRRGCRIVIVIVIAAPPTMAPPPAWPPAPLRVWSTLGLRVSRRSAPPAPSLLPLLAPPCAPPAPPAGEEEGEVAAPPLSGPTPLPLLLLPPLAPAISACMSLAEAIPSTAAPYHTRSLLERARSAADLSAQWDVGHRGLVSKAQRACWAPPRCCGGGSIVFLMAVCPAQPAPLCILYCCLHHCLHPRPQPHTMQHSRALLPCAI